MKQLKNLVIAVTVLLLVALSWVNEVRGQDLEISNTPVEEVNGEYIIVLKIDLTIKDRSGRDVKIDAGSEIQVRVAESDGEAVTYEIERVGGQPIYKWLGQQTRPFFRMENADRVEGIESLRPAPEENQGGNWPKYEPIREETVPLLSPFGMSIGFINEILRYPKHTKDEVKTINNDYSEFVAVWATLEWKWWRRRHYKKSFTPGFLLKFGNAWIADPNYFASGGPDIQAGFSFDWQYWFFNQIHGDLTIGAKFPRNSDLEQDIVGVMTADIGFSIKGFWVAGYFSGEQVEAGFPSRYMELNLKHQFHPQSWGRNAMSLGTGVGKVDYEIGDTGYGYWKFMPLFIEYSRFTTNEYNLIPKQHTLRLHYSYCSAGNVDGPYAHGGTLVLRINLQ